MENWRTENVGAEIWQAVLGPHSLRLCNSPPGVDGAEICRERRTRRNKPYTYLIPLFSKDSKQNIVKGLESGADDYLTIPFDAEELKARRRAGHRILDLEDRLVEARESMRFHATHNLLTSLWNRGVIVELLCAKFTGPAANKTVPPS